MEVKDISRVQSTTEWVAAITDALHTGTELAVRENERLGKKAGVVLLDSTGSQANRIEIAEIGTRITELKKMVSAITVQLSSIEDIVTHLHKEAGVGEPTHH